MLANLKITLISQHADFADQVFMNKIFCSQLVKISTIDLKLLRSTHLKRSNVMRIIQIQKSQAITKSFYILDH